MPRSPERDAGLNARHTIKLQRGIGCRYTDVDNRYCGNAVTDPDAPIRLCPRHAGLALEWLLPKIKAQYLTEINAAMEAHDAQAA